LMSPMTCQLDSQPSKLTQLNDENVYNHNFKGKYCWCNEGYDQNSGPLMIQCVRCQDWYHPSCINQRDPKHPLPENLKIFGDFICIDCVTICPFLLRYEHLLANTTDATSSSSFSAPSSISNNDSGCLLKRGNQTSNISKKIDNAEKREEDREEEQCADNFVVEGRNTFWTHGWRKKLCRCTQCSEMFKLSEIGFLLTDEPESEEDQEDEEKDENAESNATEISPLGNRVNLTGEDPLIALADNSLPRAHLLDMVAGYNDLRDHLSDFLRPFAEAKRTVTKRDIEDFFGNLQKRPKYV